MRLNVTWHFWSYQFKLTPLLPCFEDDDMQQIETGSLFVFSRQPHGAHIVFMCADMQVISCGIT